jgi:hypothetical protein
MTPIQKQVYDLYHGDPQIEYLSDELLRFCQGKPPTFPSTSGVLDAIETLERDRWLIPGYRNSYRVFRIRTPAARDRLLQTELHPHQGRLL